MLNYKRTSINTYQAKLEKPYGTWSILKPGPFTQNMYEIALIKPGGGLVNLSEYDQIERFETEQEALNYIESYSNETTNY